MIPEYVGSIKEEAIVDHAFSLVFALDEVITYGGMNEPIPLQQVRVNLVCVCVCFEVGDGESRGEAVGDGSGEQDEPGS